jgi:hypothetical protein
MLVTIINEYDLSPAATLTVDTVGQAIDALHFTLIAAF